jgi:hypothetical protein
MNDTIHMQLLTLVDGHRILRLEDPATGLSLERRLDPEKPLVAQKARLLQYFETMLQSEAIAA